MLISLSRCCTCFFKVRICSAASAGMGPPAPIPPPPPGFSRLPSPIAELRLPRTDAPLAVAAARPPPFRIRDLKMSKAARMKSMLPPRLSAASEDVSEQ